MICDRRLVSLWKHEFMNKDNRGGFLCVYVNCGCQICHTEIQQNQSSKYMWHTVEIVCIFKRILSNKHFHFLKRYYTPLQPAFYPFPFHEMMTASPNMAMMNDEQQALQGDPNCIQEPVQGMLS